MERAAWWATVNGISKRQTRLSNLHFHFSSLGLGGSIVSLTLQTGKPRPKGVMWLERRPHKLSTGALG